MPVLKAGDGFCQALFLIIFVTRINRCLWVLVVQISSFLIFFYVCLRQCCMPWLQSLAAWAYRPFMLIDRTHEFLITSPLLVFAFVGSVWNLVLHCTLKHTTKKLWSWQHLNNFWPKCLWCLWRPPTACNTTLEQVCSWEPFCVHWNQGTLVLQPAH